MNQFSLQQNQNNYQRGLWWSPGGLLTKYWVCLLVDIGSKYTLPVLELLGFKFTTFSVCLSLDGTSRVSAMTLISIYASSILLVLPWRGFFMFIWSTTGSSSSLHSQCLVVHLQAQNWTLIWNKTILSWVVAISYEIVRIQFILSIK